MRLSFSGSLISPRGVVETFLSYLGLARDIQFLSAATAVQPRMPMSMSASEVTLSSPLRLYQHHERHFIAKSRKGWVGIC